MSPIKHSPSDLVQYFISPYEYLVKKYSKEIDPNFAISDPVDPFLTLIAQKGEEHEAQVFDALRKEYTSMMDLSSSRKDEVVEDTVDAMRSGVELIYQGGVSDDSFYGRTDFLIKTEGNSTYGNYSYAVWDAKLSKSIKSEYIIQLCCYAQMLSHMLRNEVSKGTIVFGTKESTEFNLKNYIKFYSSLRNEFLQKQDEDITQPPAPEDYASWGRYSEHAKQVLTEKDHLLLIADIRRLQVATLLDGGIRTLRDLAADEIAMPKKMDKKIFSKLQRQARIQIKTRETATLQYEVLTDVEQGLGLSALPPQSTLDCYLDLESNPLNQSFTLHYLWGVAHEDRSEGFDCWWAHNEEKMKQAFENFTLWAYARWLENKSMHIYHYGQFEVSALRKLMGHFGTMENEIDNLLRKNVFVDLYRVVRQGLVIGAEGYGLKKIEPLFRGMRKNTVESGQDSTVTYEVWTHKQEGADHKTSTLLKEIWDYNKDDCLSLIDLAGWLRNIQQQQKIKYIAVAKEDKPSGKQLEKIEEQNTLNEMHHRAKNAKDKPHAILLLDLCNYHRRESKPVFWRMFDCYNATDEELFNDLDCMSALTSTKTIEELTSRSYGHEYSFDPSQESKCKQGDTVKIKQDLDIKGNITIHSLDASKGICVLKTTESSLPARLSLVLFDYIPAKKIEESIISTTISYLQSGRLRPCLNNILDRTRPYLKIDGKQDLSQWGKSTVESAQMIASNLDEGSLCIQGPPGTGKTFVASRLIAQLVKKGNRVGVTSNSHKAINNLLEATVDHMHKEQVAGKVIRIDRGIDPLYDNERIHVVSTAAKATFNSNDKIYAGTAWAFSSPIFSDMLDYLFIDESGQVSLANVVAMSQSTNNIIFMGDQMQLSQPTQGVHPGQSGLSCLDYLLGDIPTVPSDRGLLLPTSYRLHPTICQFVSQKFYEGRLLPQNGNDKRMIIPKNPSHLIKPSGIHYVPLRHQGNEQSSDEEANIIKEIINELLSSKKVDEHGKEVKIIEKDILILSPYNHQTRNLIDKLGNNFDIGTVDKFQGRESAIVILSMASSDIENSPRGAQFLFEQNRINVALTRAQILAIIVGSEYLTAPISKNLSEMKLINFYIDVTQYGSSSNPKSY